MEEGVQIRPAGLAEGSGKILPGRLLKQLFPRNLPQTRPERLVSHPLACHMKNHGGLAVPDRLLRRRGTADEFRQWEIFLRRHQDGVVTQNLQPVLASFFRSLLFFVQVIGDIGGQPLGPVAPGVVHPYPVSPPGMSDLVPQAGPDDERELHHRAAQKSPGGEAVAGGKKIFRHGELGKGIKAKQVAVKFKIVFCRGQVGAGELFTFRIEKGIDRHLAGIPGLHPIMPGGQG